MKQEKTQMGYIIGRCTFSGTRPSQGTIRGGLEIMHNGGVKITSIRGGVNVWTGSGDVWVIYRSSREIGKHVFEVSGSVQTCNDF